MKRMILLSLFCMCISLCTIGTTAFAASMPVANWSFEEGSVIPGTFYNPEVGPGWSGDDGAGWEAGLFDDTSPDDDPIYSGIMPNGNKCAMITVGRALWQTLAGTLAADKAYTLSVRVGGRHPYTPTGYKVALVVGNFTGDLTTGEGTEWVYLAQNAASLPLTEGSFLAEPVIVTGRSTNLAASWLGQPVSVVIKGEGQVIFDAVTVEETDAPASFAVANWSFEQGAIPSGTFQGNAVGPGWNGDDGWYDASLYNDTFTDPIYSRTMPDGHKCASSSGITLWQTLSGTMAAGKAYRLSAWVGERIGFYPTGYKVALVVGNFTGDLTTGEGTEWAYLAQNTTSLPLWNGSFFAQPVVVTGQANDLAAAWQGQRVSVVLRGEGGHVLFDAVTVEEADPPPPLAVANWSFEEGAVIPSTFYNPVVGPGWNGDDGAGWEAGLFDDSSPGDPLYSGVMPHGDKCAMIQVGRTLWQTLPGTLAANKPYTLSVWVGARAGYNPTGYKVGLVVGNFTGDLTTGEGTEWVYLAQNTTVLPLWEGSFLAQPVMVIGKSSDLAASWLGQPVSVVLMAEGQAIFDAVTVTDTEPVIPYDHVYYSDDIDIDGDLSDWADANWKTFDTVYDSSPVDIPYTPGASDNSAWAIKWGAGGGKVYMAAKVRDTHHIFRDAYWNGSPASNDTAWAERDAVELYLHTIGTDTGPYGANNYVGYQEQAQEWTLGITAASHNAVWATCGYPPVYGNYTPSASELVAAGREVGGWLYYEAAITPFEYFGGRRGNPSIVSPLAEYSFIGADATAVGNNGLASPSSNGIPGYTGMRSNEHAEGGWSSNYRLFALRVLVRNGVEGTVTLQDHAGSMLGIAGTVKIKNGIGTVLETRNVVLDASGLYSFQTSLRGAYNVEMTVTGWLPGSQPVTIDADGNATANFSLVKPLLPTVGASNKAIFDAAAMGAVSKYNWTLWGKVTKINDNSFTLDDGSGVTITVNATAHGRATGDYVTVNGTLSDVNATAKTATLNSNSQSINKYN